MRINWLYILISILIIGLNSCSRKQTSTEEKSTVNDSVSNHIDTKSAKASKVNIYIENSGSMNGYVVGNTDFKKATTKILVLLKDHYDSENINIFFINSQIYKVPIPSDLVSFAQQLNPSILKVGNVGSSELNTVFRQILDSTDTSTVSLLLSDCIYSIKGNNTTNLLSHQKSLTMSAFLDKSKQAKGYATNIMKFASDFNGVYYDRNDHPHQISQLRPWYLCVIGVSNLMSDFNLAIDIKGGTIEGFQNYYTLSTSDSISAPHWSVLMSTENTGRFKSLRSESKGHYVHGIEDVEVNRRTNNNFSFAVAVDLSTIDADNEYLLDVANYIVTKGDFSITEIRSISSSQIKPSDARYIGTSTHIISLQANGSSYSDIEFSLLNKIPEWVNSSTNEDDTGVIDSTTTFGFKYMVEGIADAYKLRSQTDYYLTIDIPIQKSKSGGFGILLGVVLALSLGGVGFVIIKKNKK